MQVNVEVNHSRLHHHQQRQAWHDCLNHLFAACNIRDTPATSAQPSGITIKALILIMEELIGLAKVHGVVLNVSDKHQQSEASRAMITTFLTNMVALDKTIIEEGVVGDVSDQLVTDDLTLVSEDNPSMVNEAQVKDQDVQLDDDDDFDRVADDAKHIEVTESLMKDEDERLDDHNNAEFELNDTEHAKNSDMQDSDQDESTITPKNLDNSGHHDEEWKRLFRPWCLNCDERFDPDENDEESCRIHDGQSKMQQSCLVLHTHAD